MAASLAEMACPGSPRVGSPCRPRAAIVVAHRGGAMADLRGKIAVVTGASRGVGKGIARGLGEAGATVYVTGRSAHAADDRRGSLDRTAQEIDALGGHGIAAPCDHADDAAVERVFARVHEEHG